MVSNQRRSFFGVTKDGLAGSLAQDSGTQTGSLTSPIDLETLTSNSSHPQDKPAANLSRYFHNWENITKSQFILNIIKYGYKIQLINSIALPHVITTPSKEKFPIIQNEILKGLQAGVIKEIVPEDSDIVSRVFTVPKPSGEFRMIID